MSSCYHSITCHSAAVAKFGNKLDYLGIVCLIAGSFVPSVYYGFYCFNDLKHLYWSMIISLSALTAAFTLFDKFRTPEWRPYRTGMFIGLGLTAVFPVIHACRIYDVCRYIFLTVPNGLVRRIKQANGTEVPYSSGRIIHIWSWPLCVPISGKNRTW